MPASAAAESQMAGNRNSATASGLPSSKDDQSGAGSESSGSLTKKRPTTNAEPAVIGLGSMRDNDGGVEHAGNVITTGETESVTATTPVVDVSPPNHMLSSTDHGHSRNSSNTSQVRIFGGRWQEEKSW